MKGLLYEKVYIDIRDKIINNDFDKGEKLPSVRLLSKKLNVSTTTIEKAYNQLLVEGYIKSVPRSGYFVNDISSLNFDVENSKIEPINYEIFQNDNLCIDLFDMKNYKMITNKIFNYQYKKLYSSCDPRGEIELREEIRKFVLQERNVICDVDQIVIAAGTQQLLHILINLTNKKSVCFLTPEFKKAMDIFRGYNYSLTSIKSIDELSNIKSDFMYISPSNIYPTGNVVKVKQRNDIIKWANENNSFIIEDDYNYFIRYNSYTIPSIHSYNKGESVVYIGSFSKMIIPSIRISFMILPSKIYKVYKNKFVNFSQGVSKLEQLSLALFMKEGYFKRHTKKIYNSYKVKNYIIRNIFKRYMDSYDFKIIGADSNLHIILEFNDEEKMNRFIIKCKYQNLKYRLLREQFWVIFPYSGLKNNEIELIISKLF